MEEKINGTKVLSNMIWRFAERWTAQIVSIVVSIILARMLDPSDYGTIALLDVFIGILSVFISSGMGQALIQKKDADELDYSSIFFFNIIMCTFLYLVLFLCAPLIASFYEKPELIPLTRVIGLTLVISGIKSIQDAHISKTLQFKKFFWSTLFGTIISAVVGITMAFAGKGYWALVAQSLTNLTVDMIILWFTSGWKPQLLFSLKRLKVLFSYGWKLLMSALLNNVYSNIQSMVIGKLYSSRDLAFFNRGSTYPGLIINNVNTAMDSVLFPTMAAAQDKKDNIKAMTRRSMKTSTYVMAPLMFGLAAIGTPLIRLLLTEKWLPVVPFMVIYCITYSFYPIHTANLNAIKALGRSDIFLKLEILKKGIGFLVLIITAPISVMAMAYSLLLTSFISQIINSFPNKRLLNYGYLEQLKDICPGILLAAVMGIIIYPISKLGMSDYLIIPIQILVGGAFYLGISAILHLESFTYVLGIAKIILTKKRNRKANR